MPQVEAWLLLLAWSCNPPTGAACYHLTSLVPHDFMSYEECEAYVTTWPAEAIKTHICFRRGRYGSTDFLLAR